MAVPTASSLLDITGECIIETSVQPSEFIPKSANLFPKFPTLISADSWELWEFDTFSPDGSIAFGCSLYRDARGVDHGGFHAEINALWPDGTHWGETLYFAVTEVVQEADGSTYGSWMNKEGEEEKAIVFRVSPDCSVATVNFNIPGKFNSTMELRNTSGISPMNTLPASDIEAQLCPGVYYTFPMGPVTTSVTATFVVNNEARELFISTGHGGMVRGWSAKPWPTFMNEAYYVVAQVGPYMLQILRTLGSVFVKHQPFAVVRLYCDGALACATNKIVGEEEATIAGDVKQDVVRVTKVQRQDAPDGLAGKFRDGNVGYILEIFNEGESEWKFDIVHKRAVWSEPTSAPGPNGTGKSGWIEAFAGGKNDEKYEGYGFGGQLQIPVP